MKKIYYSSIYGSMFVLCAGLFTSLSFLALSHILLAVASFFFFFKFFEIKKIQVSSSTWSLIALFAICVLSLVFNWGSLIEKRGFSKIKYLFFGVMGVWLYQDFVKTYLSEKQKKLLLNLLLWTTTIATLSGLVALWFEFHPFRVKLNPFMFKKSCHPERNCGMFGMYMSYGYGISFFMVICTGLLLYREKISDYVSTKSLILIWIVNFVGLYFSFARGGLIGFLGAVPFFLFKKNKRKFSLALLAIILGTGLSFTFVPKLKNLFEEKGRIDSINIRLTQFKLAFLAFKEKPILGLGYLNFEPNSGLLKNKYKLDYGVGHEYDFFGHAHNNFFEHLASTGILGLIALVAFHGFWFVEMLARKDLLSDLGLPFIVCLFISGQFQYTFGDAENMFLIMFFYSLTQINPSMELQVTGGKS